MRRATNHLLCAPSMRWSVGCLLVGLLLVRDARADDNIVAPVPTTPIEVQYPEHAHGEAEVVLELLVAEDGSVARVGVKSGAEPFAEAARRKAEVLRFAPATR